MAASTPVRPPAPTLRQRFTGWLAGQAARRLLLGDARAAPLLRQLPLPCSVLGPSGRYVFANAAAQELLGRREAELLGHNPMEFMHPDDVAEVQANFWLRLRAGGRSVQPLRLLRPDGEVVAVRSFDQVHSWRGRMLALVSVALPDDLALEAQRSDLQSRHQAQAEQERQLRQELESAQRDSLYHAALGQALDRARQPEELLASVALLLRPFCGPLELLIMQQRGGVCEVLATHGWVGRVDERYLDMAAGLTALPDESDDLTVLTVPSEQPGVLRALCLRHRGHGGPGSAHFGERLGRRFDAAARALGLALDRQQLLADLSREVAFKEALLDVSRLADLNLGPQEMTARAVAAVARVADVDWAGLVVLEADGPQFVTAFERPDLPPEHQDLLRQPPGALGLAQQVWTGQQPVFVDDYAAHPQASAAVVAAGVRSVALMPITPKDQTGVLFVATRTLRPRAWLAADRDLFEAAARSVRAALARQQQLAHLHSAAHTDALTGLGNRRAFETALQGALQPGGRPFAVLMTDLDGLKQVNDQHGHDQGDALLRGYAQALCEVLRPVDQVFRLGGDEFAALLPDTASDHQAALLARVDLAVGRLQAQGFRFLGASAGLAFSTETANLPDLLRRADLRMYDHKGRHSRAGSRGSPPAALAGPPALTEQPASD